jgi:hypothetical protein
VGFIACAVGIRGHRSPFGMVGFGLLLLGRLASIAVNIAIIESGTDLIRALDGNALGIVYLAIMVLDVIGTGFVIAAVFHGRRALTALPPEAPRMSGSVFP